MQFNFSGEEEEGAATLSGLKCGTVDIIQDDYISYKSAVDKGLTRAQDNDRPSGSNINRNIIPRQYMEERFLKHRKPATPTIESDSDDSNARPGRTAHKKPISTRSRNEHWSTCCGKESCRTTSPESDTMAQRGYEEGRESVVNMALEQEAATKKESAVFLTPRCMGWESLCAQKGFRYCKGARLPTDGKKYLVRDCTMHLKSQRLMATRLPCCSDWHFDPIEVLLFLPKEGVQLDACIDHVGFTRLLEMEPQRFWAEHDFTSDESRAEMCLRKQAAFKKVAGVRNVTALLKNCGEGNILISAILL